MSLPYCFILGSALTGYISVAVGSAAVFVLHDARAQWFKEVRRFFICPGGTFRRAWKVNGGVKQTMMGSRLRVWATMILFSFPFMFLAISIHLFALGE